MADQYEELRRALADGPTPGPWNHVTYMSGTQNVEFPGARGVTFVDEVRDAEARAICSDNDTKPFPWLDVHHRPEDKGNDLDPQRTRNAAFIAAANPATILSLLAELDALRAATIKQSLTVQTDYAELRRAIASGNPLTVYMHREAMMTPLEGDVRELVRELDAIREDARRLDWLQSTVFASLVVGKTVEGWAIYPSILQGAIARGQTIREAIDAALHPSKDADSGEVGK